MTYRWILLTTDVWFRHRLWMVYKHGTVYYLCSQPHKPHHCHFCRLVRTVCTTFIIVFHVSFFRQYSNGLSPTNSQFWITLRGIIKKEIIRAENRGQKLAYTCLVGSLPHCSVQYLQTNEQSKTVGVPFMAFAVFATVSMIVSGWHSWYHLQSFQFQKDRKPACRWGWPGPGDAWNQSFRSERLLLRHHYERRLCFKYCLRHEAVSRHPLLYYWSQRLNYILGLMQYSGSKQRYQSLRYGSKVR